MTWRDVIVVLIAAVWLLLAFLCLWRAFAAATAEFDELEAMLAEAHLAEWRWMR